VLLIWQMCFNVDQHANTNHAINAQLKDDAKKAARLLSLLLLGTGESGKSTILKQFRILHLDGFNKDEVETYKRDIRMNVIHAIIGLSRAARSSDLPSNLQEDVEIFSKMGEFEVELDPKLASKITKLWSDPAFQKIYENRGILQIQSNAALLLNSVERIGAVEYIPTSEDILCSRVRTTGIVEAQFSIDESTYRVLDVGGQRSERRKWINFFEGISALLFVIALDEYDMVLFEDNTTNRMKESMFLFEEMCNSSIFEKTPVILFLNKKDLFEEKITRVSLSKYFPGYKGGDDFEQACQLMKSTYLKLNHSKKAVYCHFTCATNTQNIQHVFDDIRHSVLIETLATAGVMM